MDQHADDLAALLDYLGVRKAVIAGLSMGGYVAFAYWRRHPERVAALALLDTRAVPDSPEARDGRTATIQQVRERGVSVLVEEMMPRLLNPANLRDDRLAGAVEEIIQRQPAEGMIGALAAMRDREDSTPTLPTIKVPTYVIGGEDDVITPPDVTVTMAKMIPDARSVLILNAGHLSPMENPGEVNMALSELLSVAQF
jgi:pimeloyl-ACP methyl ester carboxylesterase